MPAKRKSNGFAARRAGQGGGWIIACACIAVVVIAAWLGWPRRGETSGDGPRSRAEQAAAGPIVRPQAEVFAEYAGSASCRDCHAAEFRAWQDSRHGLAERPPSAEMDSEAFVPPREFSHGAQTTAVSARDGKFEIVATGLDGDRAAREVVRVIGHEPLRQYLVAAPGGRLQTMEASWAPGSNVWFNVFGEEDRQPGEWGHWTGRGMNWNSMCGTCHNTRFRKNYDPDTDSYSSAMAEMTVGCESCHGPMKSHVSWQLAWQGTSAAKGTDPTLAGIPDARRIENCAPCHARRSELTGDFAPGDSFWDHFLLSIVDESDVFYPDGQVREEDYEFAPFLGSRMHAAGVSCMDCHEPHSLTLRKDGNALCMQCHDGSRAASPVIDPATHSFHAPGSAGSQCANCHMPQTDYMQNDWRHDHGFTIPDPLLTRELGIPNACNRCHADRDAEWALSATETWYGERMDRPARRRTRLLAAAREGEESSIPGLVALLGTPETPYWKAVAVRLVSQWIHRPEARRAVFGQLTNAHPLPRYNATQALATLAGWGDGEARAALRERLEDSSRAVRFSAAWALRDEVRLETRAGRELAHALRLNSDQPTGQAQLGAFALSRGQPAVAVSHYARAVAWDPGSAALRQDYAVALSSSGNAREAARQAQEAARIQPDVAENHYRVGLALAETGDLSGAIRALEEAARLDARHDRALYNLGLAYNSAGRWAEAETALLRAEAANPGDARIPYALAAILAEKGRVSEARRALERALRLAPEFEAARDLERQLAR